MQKLSPEFPMYQKKRKKKKQQLSPASRGGAFKGAKSKLLIKKSKFCFMVTFNFNGYRLIIVDAWLTYGNMYFFEYFMYDQY